MVFAIGAFNAKHQQWERGKSRKRMSDDSQNKRLTVSDLNPYLSQEQVKKFIELASKPVHVNVIVVNPEDKKES